jgi:hypothetical protein
MVRFTGRETYLQILVLETENLKLIQEKDNKE